MTSPALLDLSQASANAMLTARTSKVISGFIRGHVLDQRSQVVVTRAAEFLAGIVQGSLLVEGKQHVGFAPSHENLREYDRALSALQALNLVSQDASFADLFMSYRERLLRLAGGQAVAEEELKSLRQFFSALSSFFDSDLTRPPSERRGERVTPER
jgi:hypothetical protein